MVGKAVCVVTTSLITQNAAQLSHAPQQCRITLWIVSFKCLWGHVIQAAQLVQLCIPQLADSEEGDLLQ